MEEAGQAGRRGSRQPENLPRAKQLVETAGARRRRAGRAPHRRRVVVGVDGSAGSARALEWAVGAAKRLGAALEVHAAYGPGGVFSTPKEIERQMHRLLDQSLALVAGQDPDVETMGVTHEGSPAAALVEASDGAELLVVGSRGRGGFAGLLLGSVSQQCAVHARCPVVIVRPTPEEQAAAQWAPEEDEVEQDTAGAGIA